MKWPWKREPEDLVAQQVAEAQARTDLHPPANHWSNWATPPDPREGGILLLPEEVTFPGDSTLRADGGWCAPSELMYAMERALAPTGKAASAVPLMISVPEVHVQRGGWPVPRTVYDRKTLKPYPNPAFLAASVANPGLLPLAFMRDPTAP